MAKVIRVRFEGLLFFQGSAEFEVKPVEGDVFISARSDHNVKIYAISTKDEVLPLCSGEDIEQTFNFAGDCKAIRVSAPAKAQVALKLHQAGTMLSERPDPVPTRVPVPLNDDSLDARMRRMLSAYGLIPENTLGTDYDVPDEDGDDDPEFGSGYAVDPDLERDIEEAAMRVISALGGDLDKDRMVKGIKEQLEKKSASEGDQTPASKPAKDDKPSQSSDPATK